MNPATFANSTRSAFDLQGRHGRGHFLRIGVNAGSLDKELYAKYGGPTPEALVASAMKEARMFEDVGFHDFKISVKHHDVVTMVQTYRLLASKGRLAAAFGRHRSRPDLAGHNQKLPGIRRAAWPKASAIRSAFHCPRLPWRK